jgi:hypothetical protein
MSVKITLFQTLRDADTDWKRLDIIEKKIVRERMNITLNDAIVIISIMCSDSYRLDFIKCAAGRIANFGSDWIKLMIHFIGDSYRFDLFVFAIEGAPITKSDDFNEQIKFLIRLLGELTNDSYKYDCIMEYFKRSELHVSCEQMAQLFDQIATDSYKVDILKAVKSRLLDYKSDAHSIISAISSNSYKRDVYKTFGLEVPENLKKRKGISGMLDGSLVVGGMMFSRGGGSYTSTMTVRGNKFQGGTTTFNSLNHTKFHVSSDHITMDGNEYYDTLNWNNIKFDFIVRPEGNTCRVFDRNGSMLFLYEGDYQIKDGVICLPNGKPVDTIGLGSSTADKKPNTQALVEGEITTEDITTEENTKDVELTNPCVICLDKNIATVILPCRHSKMCVGCAWKIKEKQVCPTCNGGIKNIIKIY